MKKISFLLTLCLFLIVVMPNVYKVEAAENVELEKLNVMITGTTKSVIKVSFTTETPLMNLEIWLDSEKDGGINEQVYGERKQNDGNICKVIKNAQKNSDNKYDYAFEFQSQSGKIATFELIVKYELNGKKIDQGIYVTNGNPNLEQSLFSTINSVKISIVVALFGGIGTFLIIKANFNNHLEDPFDEEYDD